MKRSLAARLSLPLLVAVCLPGVALAEPGTEEEKTLYYLGVRISKSLEQFALSADEKKQVVDGLSAGLAGTEVALDPATYDPKLLAFQKARQEIATQKELAASAEFVKQAASAAGAQSTPSGLVYTETKAGSGKSPAPTDIVRVHYHGTLRDGSVFDSSVDRGQPAEFPLNRVIPCWTEGVAKMKVGGKSTLVCPAEIAYGDRGTPGIPGGSALRFDVELIEIVQQP